MDAIWNERNHVSGNLTLKYNSDVFTCVVFL